MFDLNLKVSHIDAYYMYMYPTSLNYLLYDQFFVFWIMIQIDITFDIKLSIGHSNLCFMI